MESFKIGPLIILGVIWAVVTLVWIGLLFRRGLLAQKEDDQLFLDQAEEHLAREQRELVERIERMSKPIMLFGISSGVLLLALAGVWVWEGLEQGGWR